jgi:hypothetical protein
MRQDYNLDRLAEYRVEVLPDTTRVINPPWRQLDSQIRRQNGLLSRQLVQFAEIQLPKSWSQSKSKPMSSAKANCSRPLKTGGKKSSNSKHSAKRLLNTSY